MENDFYNFNNDEEADKWLNDNYGEFMKTTHEDYKTDNTLGEVLYRYTGSISRKYNKILDDNNGEIENIESVIDKVCNKNPNDKESGIDHKLSQDAKKDIKLIYEAFSMNNITENIFLFHYFNMNYIKKESVENQTFQINHFISTSLLKKTSGIKDLISKNKYNALLVIKTKKGIPCIPIGNNNHSILREFEIILKPKTQFRICKKKKKIFSKIKFIIECELI